MEVSGLGFRYSRVRPWLFRNLGFTLERGEILSILGPNARGKTTLLKCLSGLLAPREGQITTSAAVGYVPQDHGAGGTSYTVAAAATCVHTSAPAGRTTTLPTRPWNGWVWPAGPTAPTPNCPAASGSWS